MKTFALDPVQDWRALNAKANHMADTILWLTHNLKRSNSKTRKKGMGFKELVRYRDKLLSKWVYLKQQIKTLEFIQQENEKERVL